MNVGQLIDGVVQQTTILIAHLATAGGVRAPLAQVANQVFVNLTEELQRQGVQKNVIADMFGMALRTYHRRVRTLSELEQEAGRTVWDAVLGYVREREPVSLRQIQSRFAHDDASVVSGVLSDLVRSGLVYRSGRGDGTVFRLADPADFVDPQAHAEASEYLVWLAVYRQGPVSASALAQATRLSSDTVAAALETLTSDGRVVMEEHGSEGEVQYRSPRFEVPAGQSLGWEAAVLDHFQSLVAALCVKLRGDGEAAARATGGTTFTFDVGPGHPLQAEAEAMLERVREQAYGLRARIDQHNAAQGRPESLEPVVFYAGQYVKTLLGEEEE